MTLGNTVSLDHILSNQIHCNFVRINYIGRGMVGVHLMSCRSSIPTFRRYVVRGSFGRRG